MVGVLQRDVRLPKLLACHPDPELAVSTLRGPLRQTVAVRSQHAALSWPRLAVLLNVVDCPSSTVQGRTGTSRCMRQRTSSVREAAGAGVFIWHRISEAVGESGVSE